MSGTGRALTVRLAHRRVGVSLAGTLDGFSSFRLPVKQAMGYRHGIVDGVTPDGKYSNKMHFLIISHGMYMLTGVGIVPGRGFVPHDQFPSGSSLPHSTTHIKAYVNHLNKGVAQEHRQKHGVTHYGVAVFFDLRDTGRYPCLVDGVSEDHLPIVALVHSWTPTHDGT